MDVAVRYRGGDAIFMALVRSGACASIAVRPFRMSRTVLVPMPIARIAVMIMWRRVLEMDMRVIAPGMMMHVHARERCDERRQRDQ